MDLQQMAVNLMKQQFDGADENAVSSALTSLLGGNGANLDLSSLVDKLSGGGLAGALTSWLGNGGNESVSADQITAALGADRIATFAGKLGVGPQEAAQALSSVLPELIDGNSSNGALIGNVAGLASKLFK